MNDHHDPANSDAHAITPRFSASDAAMVRGLDSLAEHERGAMPRRVVDRASGLVPGAPEHAPMLRLAGASADERRLLRGQSGAVRPWATRIAAAVALATLAGVLWRIGTLGQTGSQPGMTRADTVAEASIADFTFALALLDGLDDGLYESARADEAQAGTGAAGEHEASIDGLIPWWAENGA